MQKIFPSNELNANSGFMFARLRALILITIFKRKKTVHFVGFL